MRVGGRVRMAREFFCAELRGERKVSRSILQEMRKQIQHQGVFSKDPLMNRGTALLSKKEDASARDASDRPGRAERKGSGRGMRTQTMFSGTIPRRTTPLPPLRGPLPGLPLAARA